MSRGHPLFVIKLFFHASHLFQCDSRVARSSSVSRVAGSFGERTLPIPVRLTMDDLHRSKDLSPDGVVELDMAV